MTSDPRDRTAAVRGDLPAETVDARDPRGDEQELAAGRSSGTPFTLLSWVTVAIAAVVVLVVAIAALAYAAA